MAILNITYQGQSADYELALDFATTDADIRRIAVEVVRSGGVRGLHLPNLPQQRVRVLRRRPPDGSRRRAAHLPAPEGAVRRDRCGSSSAASARSARRACSTCRNLDAELRLVDFDRVESQEPRRAVVREAVARQEQGGGGAPPARELLRREGRGDRRAARRRQRGAAARRLRRSRSTASTTRTAAIVLSRGRARSAACRSCTPRSPADGTFGLVRWDERFTRRSRGRRRPGDLRGRRAPADDRPRRRDARARDPGLRQGRRARATTWSACPG